MVNPQSSPAGTDGAPEPQAPPGRGAVSKWGIVAVLLLVTGFALLNLVALVWVWPPQIKAPTAAGPTAKPATSVTSATPSSHACEDGQVLLDLGPYRFCPTQDQRLLWMVFLAGMLGGVIHALRSLSWYVGNRRLVRSWVPWYLLLPLLGGLVSVVFFLVIRGGFFLPQPTSTSGDAANPYGFAAFSALIGLFTNQALLKLQQTFESLLVGREQGKDQVVPPLSVKSLNPTRGRQAEETSVHITGGGFTSLASVKFGAQPAGKVTVVSDTDLVVSAPPQAAGTVDVELVAHDGKNAVLHQSFTYV